MSAYSLALIAHNAQVLKRTLVGSVARLVVFSAKIGGGEGRGGKGVLVFKEDICLFCMRCLMVSVFVPSFPLIAFGLSQSSYPTGEKYLKLVTYNLGSLTPTNLLSIQESPTFQYLSTFDIVLLQGTNGDEGTSQKILSMIRSGNTVNATEIESTTLGGGSNYVEIFYRASEDRTVNCINERYGHNKNSIVACLFSAANSTSPLKPFIVANINDAHDGLLTSPIKDLEDDDVGIMKRVYARLCVQPECEDYGVPAVFVGTWGTALRGSGTWEAFKSGVESVEDEM